MLQRAVVQTVVTSILFVLSESVFAATFTVTDVTLSIRSTDSASGQVVLGDQQPATLDSVIDVTQGDRERVIIEAGNINPVLFSYSISEPTITPTSSAEAVSEFAGALDDLYEIIKPSDLDEVANRQNRGRAAPPTRVYVEGVDIISLLDHVSRVVTRIRAAPAQIEISAEPGNGSHANAEIRSWDGVRLHAELRQEFLQADAIRRKIFTSQPLEYRIGTGSSDTADTIEDLRDTLGQLGATDVAARLSGLQWVLSDAPRILHDASELAALENEFERIGTTLELSRNEYSAGAIASRKLTVSRNMRFEAFFTQKARDFQAARVKSVEVVLRPEERLHARISPAVAFSFVSSPAFSAMENSQGDIIVAASEDEMTINAAVSLQLIREEWYRQQIQPFFEIGVGPTSDEPSLFGGLGITAGRATLSFGLIYQKVDRLGGGLAEGSTISSVNDLVVKSEWDSGAYFSIGVKLGD